MRERADGDKRAHAPVQGWESGRSRAHSVFLLIVMASLLAYCGWIIAAGPGALWSLLVSATALITLQRMPVSLLLKSLRAEPISLGRAPALYQILAELCQTAGVQPSPLLCEIRDPFPVAFTVGAGDTAAIVLSKTVIETMEAREIRGILAHEIIHIRNGDLMLMQLAVVVGRLTRVLSQVAFMLLFLGLLLRVTGFPLGPLFVLAVAPFGVNLLQLALSRTRESEADLEAAELTDDPYGLAAALIKMRAQEQAILRTRYPGMVLLRVPPMFRDHPATGGRVRKLLEMVPPGDPELRGKPSRDFRGHRHAGPWG